MAALLRNQLWFALAVSVCAQTASAQLVPSESISNDPEKEKLCLSRAARPGKSVPFLIDQRYLNSARARNPDVVFIAIDGDSPLLIDCYLREGTGKYEPASFSGEQDYWRVLRPLQFQPGINTDRGIAEARRVCLNAAPVLPALGEVVNKMPLYVTEVRMSGAGKQIAGVRAERYDVQVGGRMMFKSNGPDLTVKDFTCLLSPMLEVKAAKVN